MKRWLSYIVMAVLCGLCLLSCATDEQVEKAGGDGNVPVRLMLAFSNFGGRAASEPGDLDYTTVEQSAMSAEDVYVLVVDEEDKYLYQVEDLELGAPIDGDNYYTRQLEGKMLRTIGNAKVKLVVLANLKDNKIASCTTGDEIRAFLDERKGRKISEIYNELVYNYDGSTPWSLVERAIPMWGSSALTEVPGTGVNLTCNLYRAVAKVGIWVNMQDGYEGFTITKIVVNNANDKGACVSMKTPDPSENVQYTSPSIPDGVGPQSIIYDDLSVTAAYENVIYLPEKLNTADEHELSLTVHYTYNDKTGNVGLIKFRTDGTEDKFDVVRNHSYLFNIKLSTSEVDTELSYQVISWTDIDNGDLNFGNGNGNVRK